MQSIIKVMKNGSMLALVASAITMLCAADARAEGEDPGPAEAAFETEHGCPDGYFCIYPRDAGWNNDRPSNKYYTYGCHNLRNQVGNHYLLNNQTGGATVYFYRSYDCKGPIEFVLVSWTEEDLTPINSIRLVEGSGCEHCQVPTFAGTDPLLEKMPTVE